MPIRELRPQYFGNSTAIWSDGELEPNRQICVRHNDTAVTGRIGGSVMPFVKAFPLKSV